MFRPMDWAFRHLQTHTYGQRSSMKKNMDVRSNRQKLSAGSWMVSPPRLHRRVKFTGWLIRHALTVVLMLLGFWMTPGLAMADTSGCADVNATIAACAFSQTGSNGVELVETCFAGPYTPPGASAPDPSYTGIWMNVDTIPPTPNPFGYQASDFNSAVPVGWFLCTNTPVQNTGNGDIASGGEGGHSDAALAAASVNVGDPINASTGNKYVQEDDFSDSEWLTFRRFYNSNTNTPPSAMGVQWSHSFNRSLVLTGYPVATLLMSRPDGTQESFTKAAGVWTGGVAQVDTLVETDNTEGVATGYTVFIGALRHTETYSATGLLQTVTDEAGQGISLTYSTTSTPAKVAPTPGLLLTVTDPKGRQLIFSYNGSGNVSAVTLPDGGTLSYAYDSNGNLSTVKYPDGAIRTYVYAPPSFTGTVFTYNDLSGYIDEAGVRYSSTTYDGSGRATSSRFAGGVGSTQITYNGNGTSTVQYPLGHSATIGFSSANGTNEVSSIDQPCGPDCDQPWQSLTYDANGFQTSATDFNGNLTTTQFDGHDLLDQQVDESGGEDQRTTNTTWDTVLRNPVARTVLNAAGTAVAETEWVYNAGGQTIARCEIDPAQAGVYTCAVAGTPPPGVRRSTYTYCTAIDATQCPVIGLLLSVVGPRTDVSDVTSYTYYMTDSSTAQHGDLQSVTDAMGQVTTYLTYDGAGRTTSMQDADGAVTSLTYSPRGWLTSRTVGGATTTMGYTPYGAVASVTDPDGVVTTFTYDGAHRLTDITDTQGNDIHYTLDAAGNKTAEQIQTSSGTVVHNLARTYDSLGHLTAVIDGLNQTVFSAGFSDSYDPNSNLVHSADGFGIQHQQGFDGLNRLVTTIANYNGSDPSTNNTQTAFDIDPLDRVDGVADPSNLDTMYTFDGLGNRTQLQSPDTGTSSDTFDAAGNRLVHTDAKGVASASAYDAKNRVISTSYADASLNVSYDYDETNTVTGCTSSAPIGRLTRVVELKVTTVFCYDVQGRVIQKSQRAWTHNDVTSYAYTAAGRLSALTYPDQTAIAYTYDSDGHISGVQVTPSGATTAPPTVVSNISYRPFGPIGSYTLGNGQTIVRTYDANYRLTDLTSPALALHFARDAMGNIVALGNARGANPATETYSYDPLYRLTGVTDAGTALESYTYNQTGDRLSKTAPGLDTGAYVYTPGTHQLASIGNAARINDADGNTTASVVGGNTYGFGYNGRNRLTVVQLNGQTVGNYTYNVLGERIGKVATLPQSATERFVYDEAGQLLGEYGTTNRDYVWLGDLPVAVVDNTINGSVTASSVNYVTADQLGTPREVTDHSGSVIWSWAYQRNPFGEQGPTSLSGYVLNFRFPGQYFDAESGSNYNVTRIYDPGKGGFDQSDPTGLAGGLSTYTYVGDDPMEFIDKLGLKLCHASLPGKPDAYVDSDFLPNVSSWLAANSADGIDTTVTSAFRTAAAQENPGSNWTTPAPASGSLASLHEAGWAVDIKMSVLTPNQQATVIANAAANGINWGGAFRHPKPDPVHFYIDPGHREEIIDEAQEDYANGNAKKCECGN